MKKKLQSNPQIVKDKLTSVKDNITNQTLTTSNNNDKINMKNNLTKKSKDTIIYCMTMFDDYITICSGKFIFLLRMLIYFKYISFDCLLYHLIFNYVTTSCLNNFISTFCN